MGKVWKPEQMSPHDMEIISRMLQELVDIKVLKEKQELESPRTP
jgi:hypothetical protein